MSFGLPALSGILLILIQPPIPLGFLAWLALVPLLLALQGKNSLQGFILGMATGFISYLGLVYWTVVAMHKYGGINLYLSCLVLVLFALYLSIYTALFGLVVTYLERRLSITCLLSAPMVWVLLEYLRGIALSGFPWSLLGHSQHNFLPIIQVASVTGTYFLSFLIAAVNCVLCGFILVIRGKGQAPRKSSLIICSAVMVTLIASSLLYGHGRLGLRDEANMKVAIVQGNISQDVKWDEAFKIRTIKTYYTKTLEAGKGFDFIIWPETALPLIFNQEIYVKKIVEGLPVSLKTTLMLGTVTKDKKEQYHNSAYAIGPSGEEKVYSKVHLVPFGEYTPFRSLLPFMERISVANGEFFPGDSHEPLDTGAGKLGVLICYEGIFPAITVETVRKGAQVLINLTNDAWYDNSSAPYQHLAFYRFRAIETERYVLRAANTGTSAIIDPYGRILARTPLFKEELLTGTYGLKDSKTFYVRYGDYFVLVVLLAFIALCAVPLAGRRKAGESERDVDNL